MTATSSYEMTLIANVRFQRVVWIFIIKMLRRLAANSRTNLFTHRRGRTAAASDPARPVVDSRAMDLEMMDTSWGITHWLIHVRDGGTHRDRCTILLLI
jgi:hypothetical protein